jgi:uncharacterized protein (DUF342 family)
VGPEEKEIYSCPSCHYRYQAPEALGGTWTSQTVSCKKCGLKFKLSPEVAGDQEESLQKSAVTQEAVAHTHERDGREYSKGIKEQKVSDTAFDLRVSYDKLEAHICPKGQVPVEISLGDIKELLSMKGIKHGIVDDTAITEYLKNEPIRKEPWKIAEGKAPGPAWDSEVKYYFDTDPSRIGTVKEGGTIDFKERGEIPQVKKGDLIAEKIPGIDGAPGIDVFDNPIPGPKPKDVKLRCGKGAEKSEDGLEVLAKLDGRPEISVDGKLSVESELKIFGDVGLETGNIDFAGSIDVRGSVQDGFRVRGGKLSAKEILRAELDIAGDLVVTEGIIGAHVKTGGNVKVKHVNASHIDAKGDVVVENEVLNSRIESSGACLAKGGKILSSSISAKKGIQVYQIGSDTSNPCTLVVGLDERTSNEIDSIKKQITLKREEQKKHQTRIDKLQKESESYDEGTGELLQGRDRTVLAKRTVKKKMEEIEKTNKTEQLVQAQTLLEGFEATIRQTEKNLELLLNKQDQIQNEITGLQDEFKNSEKEIKEFLNEIKSLSEWSRQEKGVPVVIIYGTAFSQTAIGGPHSAHTLTDNTHHASIREIKATDPDSRVEWEMKIFQLE